MLKRGTKFRIVPYGVCVVSSYDDTSGKYIMRVWNSSETFYASKEEIENKCLENHKNFARARDTRGYVDRK